MATLKATCLTHMSGLKADFADLDGNTEASPDLDDRDDGVANGSLDLDVIYEGSLCSSD
jgi:hypothetical protein